MRLIHCNTLKFQDKAILRTGQKPALQLSLFWRYANFSKLMRTIPISMTSAFQCEYCQCFTFKICDKFKLKCTGHGGMYSAHYFGKISITWTVNVVTQIFDQKKIFRLFHSHISSISPFSSFDRRKERFSYPLYTSTGADYWLLNQWNSYPLIYLEPE